MYGAILGDIIGCPFEFDRGDKTKNFPLFSAGSEFTDDTVMTIAVAEAFLEAISCGATEQEIKEILVEKMQEYGNANQRAFSVIKK